MDSISGEITVVGSVSGKVIGQGSVSGDLSVSQPPVYEGPYTVTPSDQAQTLETADLKMTQDVTVEAVPSASITQGQVEVNPNIEVFDTGLIRASNGASSTVEPFASDGLVDTDDSVPVSITGQTDRQLPTQAGATITPTESEQTAVDRWKFTTGKVKVAPIPSDYVGSEVPRKTSADLTASGRKITAPAGFYGSDASVTVDYIIDLGEVDLTDYDDDPYEYIVQALHTDGLYSFEFSGFKYIVEVEVSNNRIRQTYWSDEEGALSYYVQALTLEDGEVVDVAGTSYLDMETAMSIFAGKAHNHWRTDSGSSSVWDYCNSNSLSIVNDSPIIYRDTTTSTQYLIETWYSIYQPLRYYVRIHPFDDASVFYQRVATFSGGTKIWGSWYKFSGTVFNP